MTDTALSCKQSQFEPVTDMQQVERVRESEREREKERERDERNWMDEKRRTNNSNSYQMWKATK
jgi:hypothetical protein